MHLCRVCGQEQQRTVVSRGRRSCSATHCTPCRSLPLAPPLVRTPPLAPCTRRSVTPCGRSWWQVDTRSWHARRRKYCSEDSQSERHLQSTPVRLLRTCMPQPTTTNPNHQLVYTPSGRYCLTPSTLIGSPVAAGISIMTELACSAGSVHTCQGGERLHCHTPRMATAHAAPLLGQYCCRACR